MTVFYQVSSTVDELLTAEQQTPIARVLDYFPGRDFNVVGQLNSQQSVTITFYGTREEALLLGELLRAEAGLTADEIRDHMSVGTATNGMQFCQISAAFFQRLISVSRLQPTPAAGAESEAVRGAAERLRTLCSDVSHRLCVRGVWTRLTPRVEVGIPGASEAQQAVLSYQDETDTQLKYELYFPTSAGDPLRLVEFREGVRTDVPVDSDLYKTTLLKISQSLPVSITAQTLEQILQFGRHFNTFRDAPAIPALRRAADAPAPAAAAASTYPVLGVAGGGAAATPVASPHAVLPPPPPPPAAALSAVSTAPAAGAVVGGSMTAPLLPPVMPVPRPTADELYTQHGINIPQNSLDDFRILCDNIRAGQHLQSAVMKVFVWEENPVKDMVIINKTLVHDAYYFGYSQHNGFAFWLPDPKDPQTRARWVFATTPMDPSEAEALKRHAALFTDIMADRAREVAAAAPAAAAAVPLPPPPSAVSAAYTAPVGRQPATLASGVTGAPRAAASMSVAPALPPAVAVPTTFSVNFIHLQSKPGGATLSAPYRLRFDTLEAFNAFAQAGNIKGPRGHLRTPIQVSRDTGQYMAFATLPELLAAIAAVASGGHTCTITNQTDLHSAIASEGAVRAPAQERIAAPAATPPVLHPSRPLAPPPPPPAAPVSVPVPAAVAASHNRSVMPAAFSGLPPPPSSVMSRPLPPPPPASSWGPLPVPPSAPASAPRAAADQPVSSWGVSHYSPVGLPPPPSSSGVPTPAPLNPTADPRQPPRNTSSSSSSDRATGAEPTTLQPPPKKQGILAWIVAKINQFVNWVKSLFTSKPTTQGSGGSVAPHVLPTSIVGNDGGGGGGGPGRTIRHHGRPTISRSSDSRPPPLSRMDDPRGLRGRNSPRDPR